MAEEITVTHDDPEESPEESSAHEAAVAEGAAAVHSGNAEDAAEDAKTAAEGALAGAAVTVQAAEAAGAAAEVAEAAAEQAQVTLGMVHEALIAQGSAISALTEELKASRKPREPKPEPVTRTSDETPGSVKKPKQKRILFGH